MKIGSLKQNLLDYNIGTVGDKNSVFILSDWVRLCYHNDNKSRNQNKFYSEILGTGFNAPTVHSNNLDIGNRSWILWDIDYGVC